MNEAMQNPLRARAGGWLIVAGILYASAGFCTLLGLVFALSGDGKGYVGPAIAAGTAATGATVILLFAQLLLIRAALEEGNELRKEKGNGDDVEVVPTTEA